MRLLKRCALFALTATFCFADLTTDQKVADFMQLAGIYAKNYAPYQWKLQVIGVDIYNVKPWLDKVRATTNDVDFWDVCVQYVASLQDSHDEFTLNSGFYVWMHFDVDIYDGKVLIDGIDRSWLPLKLYPFQIGDEVVSVDGVAAQDLITQFIPYSANGSANASSRRRLAASAFTLRDQLFMPKAYQVPDQSSVVIKRANGNNETYSIKWDTYGVPLTTAGILPSPQISSAKPRLARTKDYDPLGFSSLLPDGYRRHSGDSDFPLSADRWGIWNGARPTPVPDSIPDYLQLQRDLSQMGALIPDGDYTSFGALTPVFDPPPGFKLRLGSKSTDQFLSGTYSTGPATIGFIRIPTMSPSSSNAALSQWVSEISYFQSNTDALVIDVMHNGGGSLCYIETLVAYLTSGQYTASNYQIRATDFWLGAFENSYLSAQASRAPNWVLNLYAAYVKDLQNALKDNRSMTGTIPICGPLPTLTGSPTAYSKPILVLVDELTLSAAEAFTMMLQDAGRATIVGVRTDGGGGNPGSYGPLTYSEGNTRATRTFVIRPKTVKTPGYPASNYLENAGVYPDVQADFMTAEDLATGGTPFLTKVGGALSTLLPGKLGGTEPERQPNHWFAPLPKTKAPLKEGPAN